MGEFASHLVIGVVHSPQIGLYQGDLLWSSKILVSQVGVSALGGDILVGSQESYNLRCRGDWLYQYCLNHLDEGALVHIIGKLVHVPRYVAIHGAYTHHSELWVTDQYGAVSCIQQL